MNSLSDRLKFLAWLLIILPVSAIGHYWDIGSGVDIHLIPLAFLVGSLGIWSLVLYKLTGLSKALKSIGWLFTCIGFALIVLWKANLIFEPEPAPPISCFWSGVFMVAFGILCHVVRIVTHIWRNRGSGNMNKKIGKLLMVLGISTALATFLSAFIIPCPYIPDLYLLSTFVGFIGCYIYMGGLEVKTPEQEPNERKRIPVVDEFLFLLFLSLRAFFIIFESEAGFETQSLKSWGNVFVVTGLAVICLPSMTIGIAAPLAEARVLITFYSVGVGIILAGLLMRGVAWFCDRQYEGREG